MDAVKSLRIVVLGTFAVGAVVGIALFSRLLSYALKHARSVTLATLSGFMLGSLNKVWPWKQVVETYVDRHGVVKPLVETNVLPDVQVWQGFALMIIGFAIVYVIEKISERK